jgi:hypothetical protein
MSFELKIALISFQTIKNVQYSQMTKISSIKIF